MYASATLAPPALRLSAASATITGPTCELRVPCTGAVPVQTQNALTSSLRKLLVELRYGTRLRGVTVEADDHEVMITSRATEFALRQWVASGELIAAVEAAAEHARLAIGR